MPSRNRTALLLAALPTGGAIESTVLIGTIVSSELVVLRHDGDRVGVASPAC